MDAELAVLGPATDELVRGTGGDYDDVPRPRLDRFLADGEQDIAHFDAEGPLVGMAVELWAGAGPVVAEEERDRGPVLVPVECERVLAGGEVLDPDHHGGQRRGPASQVCDFPQPRMPSQ